ncbi:MAG: hypothetical protein JSW06_01145 [Thermoplasmatales archaeon]|nr:MAG: hypothetical protein JSW06_01145 [Thermoplasmatales archaeon]
MKKKILIGSIVPVVILVLVLFTGVVGYQTSKSSTIAKASPLFKIRTNRAVDRENKVLNCRYVGKGNLLPFPKRDDKTVLVQKVIDRIRLVDDKTYEKFIANIINHARKDNKFNGINPKRIKEALYLLRDSDTPISILDADTENKYDNPKQPSFWTCTNTCNICYTNMGGVKGFLICILALPIAVVLAILLPIYLFVNGVIPTAFICPVLFH